MVFESSQELPRLERVCIDREVEGWDFDATELGDLCTEDSRRGQNTEQAPGLCGVRGGGCTLFG
ncbi:hypothetical protein B0T18DRAFT_397799 [Schizothecium vesticola]|uniref:Uncharacterized protein n=1 Tax=Schizothecium vesticola TaxID=314040 RepID=A0AA40F9M0_9PEZI|nr:hypothetical protein B0T18DRAFT_397799 [Schizothecium vesticola]